MIPGVRETETNVSARVFKAFANWRVPLEELNHLDRDLESEMDEDKHSAF